MRRWPRSAGPAQRPHASLPHQSGAGGSSHRGRLAVRSSPRHHHVPRPLEQKPVLNSNTTDRSQGKRGPRRGPRRGSRRPGHPHGGSQGVARPVQGREDGGPERSSAHSAPALEATPCDSTPVPFTSLGLDARLLEGVRDLGFVETRPIQSAVIPFALAGHDLIACAETGTGKTAAFVATPGRLMDHMRQQNADLSAIELLVLDEADRMMDMGFWPDVRRIIAALPTVRQTLLFSATMPNEVVRDALEITRDAKYVQIGQRSAPPKSITHRVEHVASGEKLKWLIEHLRRPEGPVLVFTRTKIGADRLARQLASAGVRCTALHANRSQDQRRIAVEGFKGGRFNVLVATDIAARGLDIDAIHTVINYEVPDSAETYVHRVGRTGRADEVGQAITLVAPEERRALGYLAKSVGLPLE